MSGAPQDTPRKRRPDAVLHQLPEERQLEIFARLEKDSLADVRKWLRQDGVDIGTTALSDFWHSWVVELRFRKAETQRQAVVERMSLERPEVSLEQVEEFADAVFLQTATAEGDWKAYTNVRRITEGSKRTRLEGRRLTLLEKKAAQLDAVEAALTERRGKGGLSPETLEVIENALGMMKS